jgi:hypothetical protein
MLADGVEATVRAMAQAGALDKPTARNSDASESPGLYNDTASLPDDVIAEVVHKTINERIEDGQLDECDLTVRDIARIQEAFVSMLKGIYHPRVQYPEAPAKDEGPMTKDEGVVEGNGAYEGMAAAKVVSNGNGQNGARNSYVMDGNAVAKNGTTYAEGNGHRQEVGGLLESKGSEDEEPAGV